MSNIAYTTKFLDNFEECSICLNNNKDDLIIVVPCNHVFHKQCIFRWFNES